MAVTLHDGGAGNLKAVANGRRDRLRLAREGKPSDRLAICECEYPHLSMTEAEECAERIMSLVMTGVPDSPEIYHGPKFDAGCQRATDAASEGYR